MSSCGIPYYSSREFHHYIYAHDGPHFRNRVPSSLLFSLNRSAGKFGDVGRLVEFGAHELEYSSIDFLSTICPPFLSATLLITNNCVSIKARHTLYLFPNFDHLFAFLVTKPSGILARLPAEPGTAFSST